ncbi:cytochrome P450 [Novosphingobium album (ex Hu et al. 2023)]|uniref:Cytochrome P450 n=1 Tax=Novosphingobium album (ex Hu et al. 2023) TaxID=2930093 RepID=A0ABT0AY20_9SPHN|nr:cytochrome P450 [Novosphingobium album (ex Hu et al. 2023)]MCJ2177687.1 cytochrome P450 [Novosphingobium album (ex Hu et al. 2023)]
MSTVQARGCPVHQGRDDRKSARLADANLAPAENARVVGSFAAGREILRSSKVRQAGAGAEMVDLSRPDEISFFFLDGDQHRKRRAAVAGLFAPKTIVTRHRAVMDRTMDSIIASLQERGAAPLDELSWQMAVDVAAEIIGLTESDSNVNLAKRVRAVLDSSVSHNPSMLKKLLFRALMMIRVGRFWKHDLLPVIEARRKEPKDDVISYMVKENYSRKGMIMEALSYGGAGMMTTREFIVMAAWHLFEKPALRERFLSGDEEDQFAILEEILRLEPVASLLHRRAVEKTDSTTRGGAMAEDETVCISIRDANVDEAITGPCPFELDPDRAKRMKVVGPYMSFGDGPHRCPGAQVALHETRVFLDRLLRLPGIRLEAEPDILWNPQIQGYELRGAVVACDQG